ncbi:MAG: hypothetical protein MRY74_13940 [Neomegalonema sp.]|nr:hypothetical protein [Neomegalonema sp.]
MSDESVKTRLGTDDSRFDAAVARAIAERVTQKALGDPAQPRAPQGLSRQFVEEMLAVAGNAPFHYPAHPEVRGDGPREPWRTYLLDGAGCRAYLARLDPADKPGKIADMLAAAEAMACVTWLPDPPEAEHDADGAPVFSDRNIEHVAAASAFIQSLLTLATSARLPNYWSSGGVLRSRKYLDGLGAGPNELLLGAVFLFPRDLTGLDVKPGSLRAERAGPAAWSRWAAL